MGLLSDTQVRAAAPRDTEYFLRDGDGLYLRIGPTGKTWAYRYQVAGKVAKLGLGAYPAVSLARARQKAREMAETRAEGVDPQEARRLEAEQERLAKLNTFELLARAWHGQTAKDRQWSAGYAEKVIRHLELHIFPWIGHLPVEAIKPSAPVPGNQPFNPMGPAIAVAQPADPTAAQNRQEQKAAFVANAGDMATRNLASLQMPVSPYQVMAGTVIPAALVTGINSDLPGQVIANVTEAVYDTATGRYLLIPQGSRLIGRYDSQVAFG